MAAHNPPHLVSGFRAVKIGSSKEEKIKINSSNVRLHIDPKGHIVYWIHDLTIQARLEEAKIKSYVFVQDVVDVRYGEKAIQYVPREIRSSASPGQVLTIVSNIDMTHPVFTTFILYDTSPEDVAETAETLFTLAYKVRRAHHGLLFHVEKRLAPLIYLTRSHPGKQAQVSFEQFARLIIPSNQKEDKKALCSHLGRIFKRGFIPVSHLKDTMNVIDLVLTTAMGEGYKELRALFDEVGAGATTIPRETFLRFLKEIQRAPRLNERISPPVNGPILDRNLQALGHTDVGTITFKMFVHVLWSDWMADTSDAAYGLTEVSMGKPLACYLINSSHNSYCSGLQLKRPAMFQGTCQHQHAKAEVEMYRQILLSGCRCVELDCWDGSEGPMVTHGPTALMRMNEIPLRDCCVAIMETAFKTSPYPVLLSIENHLRLSQQKKMVEIFREVFGDHLLADPLPSHPLEEGVDTPSPEELKYKILIKAKKGKQREIDMKRQQSQGSLTSRDERSDRLERRHQSVGSDLDSPVISRVQSLERLRQDTVISSDAEDEIMTDEKIFALTVLQGLDDEVKRRQLSPQKEEAASQDLSLIVNYLEADKPPKDYTAPDRRYYAMCSLNEEEAMRLYSNKSETKKAIRYNMKKISRVYPSNWRFTSDNFDPMKAWLIGAQMAALNFQTNCPKMLLNHAMFELNGNTGYVLKSKVLRDASLDFDPHSSRSRVQQMIPARLRVRVISGHFLSTGCSDQTDSLTCNVSVQVTDLDRKVTYSTRPATEHILYTKFPSEQMTFSKIMLSEMTFVHLAVERKIGMDMVPFAHRILPLDYINNGYRYVILRSAGNQNLGPACLFVHFEVTHDMATHHMLRADLADPFAQDKKNEAIRRALADPLNAMMPEPEEEEETTSWEKKRDIIRRETRTQSASSAEPAKNGKFANVRSLLSRFSKTTM